MGRTIGRPRLLSNEQMARARRLYAQGWTLKEVGAELGVHLTVISRVPELPERVPIVRHNAWEPGGKRLSLAQREEISRGLKNSETLTAIAERLGRAVSTVSREVAANGGRDDYRAWRGHARAFEQTRRPKPFKLAQPELADTVAEWLKKWWSPEQIALRLRIEHPDDPPMMQVSHETIYQALYVQGRGELRRELTRCLRSGRARRHPQGRDSGSGKIPNMVMISERPAEVEDRAVPGHWEGDLIIGKDNHSAVGTLVERSTRFVLLLHLPKGRDAQQVDQAMRHAISKLPQELVRSITWDQGKELSRHVDFTIDTGIGVYFCDPRSPWQPPAAGHQREHQRPASPVPPERDRPLGLH
jgi:IS30 family transposase